MKKYLIGAVAGFLLAVPLYAAADTTLKQVTAYLRPDLPILLDGKKVELEKAPIIYEGTTYLPLKEFGAVVGKEVSWNQATQSVEMGKVGVPATSEKNITPSENTLYGMPYIEVDGVIYFKITDIHHQVEQKGYWIKWDEATKAGYLAKINNDKSYDDRFELISPALPIESFNDRSYLSKGNYEKMILPYVLN